MKPSLLLEKHRADIRQIVSNHCAANARVFGSVLAGNDKEDSDLDLLIDPNAEATLFDIGAIRHDLIQLLVSPSMS